MERTKNAEELPVPKQEITEPVEERIRFKKIGGGSLHLKNRLIKPNEIFLAFPSEIPKAFKDVVVALDKLPVVPPVEELPPPVIAPYTGVYRIQPRGKSKSLFDVVGPDGKIINEKVLTKALAQQLVKDLEA